jgi:acyl-coenzyme A synthetase/AMP-(fatty) acid ligase
MVVVDPRTKPDKLVFILGDCGATALVTEGRRGPLFAAARAGAPMLRAILTTDIAANTVAADRAGGAVIRDLDAAFAADPALAPAARAISVDLCALIYTSGSTGEPKGVMHSHQTMTFALESLLEYLDIAEDDRIFCALPLAFDYGLYQLLMAAARAATLVLEPSFAYPAQALRVIEAEGVTVFAGVPTIYAVLADAHARAVLHLPSVRKVTNTAAALPANLHDRLAEIFPNAEIFRMYGLTECKRVSYLPPGKLQAKPDSVGIAIPGTEAMVLDADGAPVRPGAHGVLHVRGGHVMLGYWNRPEATAHMLKPGLNAGDRVLCTHDIFTVDADGYLYFVARSDEMLKTRGEKVSPLEIETALLALDGVREAAVIGQPDPVLGDAIVAFVAGAGIGEREIRRHCAERLPLHMAPTRIVLTEALPKSSNGKIDKRALAASLKAEVAA